jgi:hypothetical protein
MQRNLQNSSMNKNTMTTTSKNTMTKKAPQRYRDEYSVEIVRMKKNMFTDACFNSGILEEKPELDYALYIAYLQVKSELCNNNVLTHLEKQEERGFDHVRYVLNFDPKTKGYKSNIVEVETPSGYHYKIVKSQFFTDKNIRDIFYEKISFWYSQKYQLEVKFKAVQINPKIWNCSVKVLNPCFTPVSKDEREPDVDETTDDGKTCQDLEEAALGMPSN